MEVKRFAFFLWINCDSQSWWSECAREVGTAERCAGKALLWRRDMCGEWSWEEDVLWRTPCVKVSPCSILLCIYPESGCPGFGSPWISVIGVPVAGTSKPNTQTPAARHDRAGSVTTLPVNVGDLIHKLQKKTSKINYWKTTTPKAQKVLISERINW